jgi:hypothetical protein
MKIGPEALSKGMYNYNLLSRMLEFKTYIKANKTIPFFYVSEQI